MVSFHTRAARRQRDPVSYHERGIKAHTELSNQGGILLLVASQRLEKFLRPRFCNGTNILNHFLARHADAIIDDGNDARILSIAKLIISSMFCFSQSASHHATKTKPSN